MALVLLLAALFIDDQPLEAKFCGLGQTRNVSKRYMLLRAELDHRNKIKEINEKISSSENPSDLEWLRNELETTLKSILAIRCRFNELGSWSMPSFEFNNFGEGDVGLLAYSIRVTQIVDESTVNGVYLAKKVQFKGIETNQLSVDTAAILEGCFVIEKVNVPTSSASGSYVFRKLSHEELGRCLKFMRDQKNGRRYREYHVWRDSTGKSIIDADYIGSFDGRVTLLDRSGTEILIPLSGLSKVDQEWIREIEEHPRVLN